MTSCEFCHMMGLHLFCQQLSKWATQLTNCWACNAMTCYCLGQYAVIFKHWLWQPSLQHHQQPVPGIQSGPNDLKMLIWLSYHSTESWSIKNSSVKASAGSKVVLALYRVQTEYWCGPSIHTQVAQRSHLQWFEMDTTRWCSLGEDCIASVFSETTKMCQSESSDLICFYCTVMCPVTEYESPVWHSSLTVSQSDTLESLQK